MRTINCLKNNSFKKKVASNDIEKTAFGLALDVGLGAWDFSDASKKYRSWAGSSYKPANVSAAKTLFKNRAAGTGGYLSRRSFY